MLIPDVNILVYAHDADSPWHAAALAWWERTLNGKREVGLPWVTLIGFIRVSTNRRFLNQRVTVPDCLRRVRGWIESPVVRILTPGEEHMDIMSSLLLKLGTAGNLTTDAHLAALAIEYQAELVSNDADFSRFPGLRWFNPLRVSNKPIPPA